LVCNRCKSKESVRYKRHTKSYIVSGIEMISWTLEPRFYDVIREKVDFNPFDIVRVKRECTRPPDLFLALSKDIDSYIRFAYHDFEDPQTVYDRYLLREPEPY